MDNCGVWHFSAYIVIRPHFASTNIAACHPRRMGPVECAEILSPNLVCKDPGSAAVNDMVFKSMSRLAIAELTCLSQGADISSEYKVSKSSTFQAVVDYFDSK